MINRLLPPDPSKNGWYWIQQPYATKAVLWDSVLRTWQTDRGIIPDWDAHRRGWTLASPHPIPTPEQLDALWCVMKGLGQPAFCPSAAERYRQAGREHVHEMLRAALGQTDENREAAR